ncbi:MAG: hypothetical protein LBB11_03920 [Puniceicoccales bacterium]|jgi:hypothetical protein|nr:hypothetical protein [Puniceicoccales bacterium]
MGLKVAFVVCCILSFGQNLFGKISAALAQRRLKSNLQIVNLSTKDFSIQFYLKDKIFDFQKEGNNFCVKRYSYLNFTKCSQRNVNENWASNLIERMFDLGVPHNFFLDEKFSYCSEKYFGDDDEKDSEISEQITERTSSSEEKDEISEQASSEQASEGGSDIKGKNKVVNRAFQAPTSPKGKKNSKPQDRYFDISPSTTSWNFLPSTNSQVPKRSGKNSTPVSEREEFEISQISDIDTPSHHQGSTTTSPFTFKTHFPSPTLSPYEDANDNITILVDLTPQVPFFPLSGGQTNSPGLAVPLPANGEAQNQNNPFQSGGTPRTGEVTEIGNDSALPSPLPVNWESSENFDETQNQNNPFQSGGIPRTRDLTEIGNDPAVPSPLPVNWESLENFDETQNQNNPFQNGGIPRTRDLTEIGNDPEVPSPLPVNWESVPSSLFVNWESSKNFDEPQNQNAFEEGPTPSKTKENETTEHLFTSRAHLKEKESTSSKFDVPPAAAVQSIVNWELSDNVREFRVRDVLQESQASVVKLPEKSSKDEHKNITPPGSESVSEDSENWTETYLKSIEGKDTTTDNRYKGIFSSLLAGAIGGSITNILLHYLWLNNG